MSVTDILKIYTHFQLSEIRRLVASCEKNIMHGLLSGTGIELGAGTGLVSAVLARRPQVRFIYALECVESMVHYVQPKVFEGVLGRDWARKCAPVLGSFDEIRLPDESLDFAVEFESWHHSQNLMRSVREINRVLKKGGRVLGFDRFQPDSITESEIKALLDKVYPKEFLRRYGYPEDLHLTRRMNGEREYRKREWMDAFEQAGFKKIKIRQLNRAADFKRMLTGPSHFSYEIKKWVRNMLKHEPYSPKAFTCFVLTK